MTPLDFFNFARIQFRTEQVVEKPARRASKGIQKPGFSEKTGFLAPSRNYKMNERGQDMLRVPDNLLNDEGKRIAKRAGRVLFSLFIGCILSYIGLLLYLNTAPQPNLTLIYIWLAGTAVAVVLGQVTIAVYLNRTLPRYQVSDDVNDRTTDSN